MADITNQPQHSVLLWSVWSRRALLYTELQAATARGSDLAPCFTDDAQEAASCRGGAGGLGRSGRGTCSGPLAKHRMGWPCPSACPLWRPLRTEQALVSCLGSPIRREKASRSGARPRSCGHQGGRGETQEALGGLQGGGQVKGYGLNPECFQESTGGRWTELWDRQWMSLCLPQRGPFWSRTVRPVGRGGGRKAGGD